MNEAFDFDAFIASPSQGDNPHSHDVRGHNGPPQASIMANSVSMINSLSDQGLDSNPRGTGLVSGVSMSDLMGGNNLSPKDQMVYGAFGDPIHGGDVLNSWDFSAAVGSLGSSHMISNHSMTFDAPPDPLTATAMQDTGSQSQGLGAISGTSVPRATGMDGIAPSSHQQQVKGDNANGLMPTHATSDYRSSISAHHSHLLTKGSVGQVAIGMRNGIIANPSRSAPAVPQSQADKRPSVNGKPAAAPNSPRAVPTLQERRHLSRQSAKKIDQTTQAAQNVNVSGRGVKRGMEGDNGQISSSPQAVSSGQSAAPFMQSAGSNQSSLQNPIRSRQSSFAMPQDISSAVFMGQCLTVSGQDVPTANRYSTSGVDVLGILSRAITRPNPKISVGPVDLSCSFTISDAHHPEQPLIYASETFCNLTGYTMPEILGRNCRFLQSTGTHIAPGSERQHTDNRAVEHLKRHLGSHGECQASLINYRKDGTPFINLVTVVPVSLSTPDQVDFLVGFQVDLVEQSGAILERKEDGSYVVNYHSINDPPHSALADGDDTFKDADVEASKQAAIAQDILDLMHGKGPCDSKQWSRVLLENSQDLIYVLSLKGTFLYVSPSAERILGFTPEEIIGKSISEFCHPSDVVPVFRELKDSTSNASIAAAASRTLRSEGVANPMTKGGGGQAGPRVNLILRMRHKHDGHRWIESTGKLHLEQGKGRKVVISSGRPRPVYNLAWEHVRRSAELSHPSFWTKLSVDGLVLSSTGPIPEVLGWASKDLSGKHLLEITNYEAAGSLLQALRSSQSMTVSHMMDDGNGNMAPVFTSFYPSSAAAGPALLTVFAHVQRASPESSWMVPNVAYPKGGPQPAFDATGTSVDSLTSVFAELLTYRSSSWVFEMHQLKNVNRRLKDEIRALLRQSKDQQGMGWRPAINLPPQSPSSSLARHQSGEYFDLMSQMGQIPALSPVRRRPDHGHGHRQHLRPTPHVLPSMGSSSTNRSSSSSSELSPFTDQPIKTCSGSGDASDETAATTVVSSGDTWEKDGSNSGSDTRRGSGSQGT